MSYQFEPGEPSGPGLQRIAEEEIAHALETLDKGEEPLDHRVHEARKHLKKLRAVFALAAGSLEHGELRRSARSVRRAAHALAPLRGEAALVECFKSLEASFSDRLDTRVVERVHELLGPRSSEGHADENGLSAAKEVLQKLRGRLAEASFEGTGWAALESGFRATYARARDAYMHAMSRPDSEALHTFRTPTKRHFYQVQMLEPVWPELLHGYRKELSKLGDVLGDHHDLSLIGPELEERGLDADGLGALGTLITERSHELEKQAFSLGGRLFAERPNAISRRFEAYFDREWPTA